MYVLLFLLAFQSLSAAAHYDYRLDHARNTWIGYHHALHYTDHFKFLGLHQSSLVGAITTNHRLSADKEFHLSFTLHKKGDMDSEHDGFLALLSTQPFKSEDLDYEVNEIQGYQTKFQDTTRRIDTTGFYVLTTGGYDRSIYPGYSEEDLVITKNFARSCRGTHDTTLHFLIKLFQGTITLAVDNEDGDGFRNCHTYEAPSWPGLFYLTFIARSAWKSKTEWEVSDMIFTSDSENIGVGDFAHSLKNRNNRLFHQIHFLSQHSHLIDRNVTDLPDKHLNVTVISRYQQTIHTQLHRCNHIIDKNMDATQRTIDFLDAQDKIVGKFAEDVISSVQRLVNNTVERFATIERQSNFIINEYQEFDLDAEFGTAKAAVDKLIATVEATATKLEVMGSFPETASRNLAYLQSQESSLRSLPARFEAYMAAVRRQEDRTHELHTLGVLLTAGLAGVAALLAVLWRLSRP
jgi:hypothetical protein